MRRGGIGLAEIVARLDEAGLLASAPDADPSIAGIADDSRVVREGDLFCAWSGTAVDAHEYLDDAIDAGAVAALVERPVESARVPQVVVRDGRRAAAHAAAVVYGDPWRDALVVGITGTNGKTTTVWLLRHILAARHSSASVGTLGVRLGDGRVLEGPEVLTTPGPVDLARTLRVLVDRGVGAIAMETSSHALDQGRVDAVRFDTAVFTNLTRDHLDYHEGAAAYRAAKLRLAELVRPDGARVVNADDPAWTGLADRGARLVRFGMAAPDVDVRAVDVESGPLGSRFRLITSAGDREVALPLLGEFNVGNAVAAAAAASALGFDIDVIAERLETVEQVPGRLERIADSPCPVLRDYAHSSDALERVLDAVRPLVPGRLILVFGAGGDRDRGKRPAMGAVASRGADVVIVTSDNPRTEDPDAIIDDIVAGMDGRDHLREADRRAAIAGALAMGRRDDLILLAGKGHETYQVVGTETRPFDEKLIVRGMLDAAAQEVDA